MAEKRRRSLTNEISANFGSQNKKNDVKFIVKEKEVYASVAVLSISSPVFSDMLETNVEKFHLPEVELEHFVEFLKCIYPNILQEITEETVYWVLPLAHEYQVKILQGKCFKLLLKIVKTKYPKHAAELYRHIKLSQELSEQPSQLSEQLDLEQVCTEMASECTLDDLEKANDIHPISDATNIKIIKMALRRHEIAKQDEDFRSSRLQNIDRGNIKGVIYNLLKKGNESQNEEAGKKEEGNCMQALHNSVKKENESQNEEAGKKEAGKFFMQALRLIYRYRKWDECLKNEALGKFQSLGNLEDGDKEVYSLLPEEIKRDLEKYNPDSGNQFNG